MPNENCESSPRSCAPGSSKFVVERGPGFPDSPSAIMAVDNAWKKRGVIGGRADNKAKGRQGPRRWQSKVHADINEGQARGWCSTTLSPVVDRT